MENILADQDADMEVQGCPTFDSDDTFGKYPVFIWRIPRFKKLWEREFDKFNDISNSTLFSNTEFELKFHARLSCFSSKDLHIYLRDYKCNPTSCFARKFTLIDQSDRAEKKHITFIDTPRFNKKSAEDMGKDFFTWSRLAPRGLIEKEDNAYVRDDSIIIEISLIPLALMYKSVVSYNGILLWRIDNYLKKKQDEISGTRRCIISNSFYTSPNGYRVQAIAFLNGFDKSKDSHISMYIAFVLGEFDQLLPCPFSCMAKIFLLDQSETPDKQHVCREFRFHFTNESQLEGRHDYILQNLIEKSVYLKNDSLLFKVIVNIL